MSETLQTIVATEDSNISPIIEDIDASPYSGGGITEQDIDAIIKDPTLKQLLLGKMDGQLTTKAKAERAKRQRVQRYPYCKESFAREILPILDAMITAGKSKEFRLSDYPLWKIDTLYAHVRQPILYILDWLDPDEKYKKLIARMQIRKTSKSIGLILVQEEDTKLVAHDYRYEATLDEIKDCVKDFIENAPTNRKREIPDKDFLPFNLSEVEVDEINSLCETFVNMGVLISVIDSERIVLIKTEPEKK